VRDIKQANKQAKQKNRFIVSLRLSTINSSRLFMHTRKMLEKSAFLLEIKERKTCDCEIYLQDA
jgi:hypothetical protein